MIKLAKIKNPLGVFMQGDCTDLPFEDGEFDYVTMGFGLRNIENRDEAISEIYKVLKKGAIAGFIVIAVLILLLILAIVLAVI